MAYLAHEFLDLIEKNIHFEYHTGASTWVTRPHSTGWRVLPSLVVAQINYSAIVEQSGKKPVKIKTGQTVSLVPDLMHRFTMTGHRNGYSHWSHIQCEVLQGVSLFHLIQPPLIIRGDRSFRVGRINQALAGIFVAEPSLALLLQRQALGWELITTLFEKVSFKEEHIELVRNISRLTPVLAYIEKHLAEPVSHGLLARIACLSPSRFHVLFRSALGCAPYEYVQKLRLKKAQQLLIQTDRSIAEVARETGHQDPYHFSRIFRRNVGASPSEYRRQMVFHSL